MGAAAVIADKSGGVAVVKMHQRPVTVGQITNFVQARDVAIHRKHAISCDQFEAGPGRVGRL